MARARDELNQELIQRVTEKAKSAGVPWDTYHAEFLMGIVMQWLHENDAALTETGIRRFKRRGT